MTIRKYDVDVAITTGTQPAAGTPTEDDDLVTKGYVESIGYLEEVTTADLAAGVLDTDISTVAGTDTTLPSAKAVKAYVDALETYVDGLDAANVKLTGSQTITGGKTFDLPLIVKETTTPSTPASGYAAIYPKTDGWYGLDDSGNETAFGGGGTSLTTPTDLKNYSIVASVGSSALTIALKTKAGADPDSVSPVVVSFRNATTATGDYSTVSITAASSIVVPSGATLGHASAREGFIYVYLLENSGAAELAVSSTRFDEGSVQTSTSIGTGSDSETGYYSTTGRTSKPLRLIARLKSTQTTAGTWAAVPTEISLVPFTDQASKFLAYRTSTQSISNITETKIQFNVEAFDTRSEYDASTNYRFQPTRAGYYHIGAMLKMVSQDNGLVMQLFFRKNGSGYLALKDLYPGATANVSIDVNTIDYFNGSTDYVEVFIYQSSGVRNTSDNRADVQFWGFEIR